MSKTINEVGNKYNYLTVLKRDGSNPQGKAKWLCQCDCGNLVSVTGTALRKGTTKSCGCYQKKRTSEAPTKISLLGQTIGNFTVLESIQGTKHGVRHKWRCRCNLCGNENVYINTDNLKHQLSCGCLIESKGTMQIKEILQENQINFMQEKTFSNLIFDSGRKARFDFYVDNKYIIEYDGVQHFIQGNGAYDNKEKFQLTQEHDAIKNQYCKDNNIPLIRIPYTELDNITLEMLIPETSQYLIK